MLRCQMAVLESVLSVHGSWMLARHPLIQRFLKGAESLSPPQVHRFPAWKLHMVLNA